MVVVGGDVTHQRPRGGRSGGSSQRRLPLAHLAQFREVTYRLFSQMFLYPDEERLQAVAEVTAELQGKGAALAQFAFFGRWRRLMDILHDLGQRGLGDLPSRYVSLFVVNSEGVPCPPYESVYRQAAGLSPGWLLAQVEREYEAAGLTLTPALGELPDHVAVELEFMASLCSHEGQGWEERSLAQGVWALQRQKAFLEGHLAQWFPEFAQRVSAADRGGIFAAVATGAQSFIYHDQDLVGLLLEDVAGEGGVLGQQAPAVTRRKG